MTCAEKKDLQDRCMAASDELERATEHLKTQTGVLIDLRARAIVDKRSGQRLTAQEGIAEATRYTQVLRNYQTASSALSRHLSEHRC
jgi:hypothetical protein